MLRVKQWAVNNDGHKVLVQEYMFNTKAEVDKFIEKGGSDYFYTDHADDGAAGPKGESGKDDKDGPAGPKGDKGEPGKDGAPGKDAPK